jgi:hypothetical protein
LLFKGGNPLLKLVGGRVVLLFQLLQLLLQLVGLLSGCGQDTHQNQREVPDEPV